MKMRLLFVISAVLAVSCVRRDAGHRDSLDELQVALENARTKQAKSERALQELIEENKRLKSQTENSPRSNTAYPNSRLQPEDIFEFESVSDPQISKDGSVVVYVRHFADVMTDRRYSNLWSVNFDGSAHRPLTTGQYNDSSPRWSHDGRRLIFVSNRDGSPQIYLYFLQTSQTVKLTHLKYPPSNLAWSPDDELISFASFVPAPPLNIADMPAPPKGATWGEPARVIDKLGFRFDKRGYAESGYVHIFVMPAEPGTPRQITSGNFHHGGPIFGGEAASWTPDSKYLIISANRREDYEYDPLNNELYEFSVVDGKVRTLTDRQGPDDEPAVSPDGKYIAYVGFDDKYQGYQLTHLYVMNRDGSDTRVLSGELERSVRSPQWSPDSRGLFFIYDDKGDSKLGYYSLNGELKTVAHHLGGVLRAYSGASFSVGRGGRFAINTTRADLPSDIAVGTKTRAETEIITAVNSDLLTTKSLGQVEEFWFESSKDGRQIQGWIVKPPGFDPHKKYPLILEIHGGPFANYGPRFDLGHQFYAARGFVVLYTNPRGSTSYGEEFGNLIHHAYPGDDFYDLDSGINAVIKKGYIDTKNLFVTGGSGGGVLTCWMIGRTTRFRAAVSAYPVINWYSFVLTADISAFVTKYWFPGFPWDHTEHYMKRSLLSTVKNVKTPTLIITGEDDFRTPISESEQYYRALKLLKVESVLVRVPDEPHGIAARPSHLLAKFLHISGWFESHMHE